MGPSLVKWKGDLVGNCGMGVSVGRRWGFFWEIIRWYPRGGRGGGQLDGETRQFFAIPEATPFVNVATWPCR